GATRPAAARVTALQHEDPRRRQPVAGSVVVVALVGQGLEGVDGARRGRCVQRGPDVACAGRDGDVDVIGLGRLGGWRVHLTGRGAATFGVVAGGAAAASRAVGTGVAVVAARDE